MSVMDNASWNQSIDGRWIHWENDFENRAVKNDMYADIIRVPSQISLASETSVESIRARIADLSTERHPVQHPSGNDAYSENRNAGAGKHDQQIINPSNQPSSNWQSNMNSEASFLVESNISNESNVPLYSHLNGYHRYPMMRLPMYHYAPAASPMNRFQHSTSQPPSMHGPISTRSEFGRSNSEPLNSFQSSTHPAIVHNSCNGSCEGRSDTMTQCNDSEQENIGLRRSLIGIAAPEPQTAPVSQSSHNSYQKQNSCSSENSEDIGYSFVTQFPSLDPESANVVGCSQKYDEDRRMYGARHDHTVNSISANVKPDYCRQSPSGRTASTKLHTSGGACVTAPQASINEEKVKVFITYADEEDPDHIRTVVQISQTLLRNSIDVTVDVLEEKLKAESQSLWLDENIRKSTFVLICVSPGYCQVVDGVSNGQSIKQKEKDLHTQYIYRRLQNEYIRNGAKNKRFIPVLLSGGLPNHVPGWLCDTKVFQWPSEYEDIIYRLFGQEKYIKPEPGPPPRHTIERYDSYNSQRSSKDCDKGHQTKPKKTL